jgi:erythromycin esterase-like protein
MASIGRAGAPGACLKASRLPQVLGARRRRPLLQAATPGADAAAQPAPPKIAAGKEAQAMALLTQDASRISPDLLDGLRAGLQPLHGPAAQDDALMALLAPARLVLLGEASHGTHEFYLERAELTKRLIREHGVRAVVIEGDWPDAWEVDRYVRGRSDAPDAGSALLGFRRFPLWMWRNTVVLEFVEWLREHNAALPPSQHCGFYGMDLYSMYRSMEAVLQHLDLVDAEAARRARQRYGCFEHSGEDSQAYGYAAGFGIQPPCEDQVVQQLLEMNRRMAQGGLQGEAREQAFFAQQNARLVHNAEEYYRTMFRGRLSSWNLRDSHMAETLQALEAYLADGGAPPKMAVWAHNSHLGDASATSMGDRGEWNVGQLVRERWGERCVLVGFSTHHGTVTAARVWDEPGERRRVRPGLEGSFEDLFHHTGTERFWLPLQRDEQLRALLAPRRLQRSIGVIYAPQSERMSHYFETQLPSQFDVMIHLDETRALQPLEPQQRWHSEEPPETYPSAL